LRTFVATRSHLDPANLAWCAAFANASLIAAGKPGLPNNLATSASRYGIGIDPAKALKDDIVVLMRGHRPGQAGGHVGIATGEIDPRTGSIGMISGNRGHRVAHSWEDPQQVIVRRAPGIRVDVHQENHNNPVTGANQAAQG
jgi:hypothetical protein